MSSIVRICAKGGNKGFLITRWVFDIGILDDMWTDEVLGHITCTLGSPISTRFMGTRYPKLEICVAIFSGFTYPNTIRLRIESNNMIQGMNIVMSVEYANCKTHCSKCRGFRDCTNKCSTYTRKNKAALWKDHIHNTSRSTLEPWRSSSIDRRWDLGRKWRRAIGQRRHANSASTITCCRGRSTYPSQLPQL